MTTILQFPSTNVFEGVQFVDIRSLLPVNPKYSWTDLVGVRPIQELSTIVVHHDGMSKASTARYSDIDLAKRIAQAHINNKKHHPHGDPGFPYDLWIRNGTIYWCNDIEQREYGVGNNNGYTVNVCVSGEYKFTDALTDTDRKALYCAIIMMQNALPEDKYIKGHGEITPTHCPGFDMDTVRRDVVSVQNEIMYQKSEEYARTTAYAIANNFTYLYRLANGKDEFGKQATPGQQSWAVKKLLELEPAVRAAGLLQ